MKKIFMVFLILALVVGGLSASYFSSATIVLHAEIKSSLSLKVSKALISGVSFFDETVALQEDTLELSGSDMLLDYVFYINILENLASGKEVTVSLTPTVFLDGGTGVIHYLTYLTDKTSTPLASDGTLQEFAGFTAAGTRTLTTFKVIVDPSDEDVLNSAEGLYQASIAIEVTAP